MTVQAPMVALSDGFLGAFARIPKAQQKRSRNSSPSSARIRRVMELTTKKSTMRAAITCIPCVLIRPTGE